MSKKLSFDLEMNAQGFKQGINEAKNATAQYTNATRDLKKETEEYLNSFGSLRKQFGAAKKEAQNLAAQFAALGEAEKNSEYGQELAESLDIAIRKAAELQDVMADTNQAIKNASSDTQGWDAMKDSFEIGKDLATAYAGAVAKLTGNEKALKDLVANVAMVQGAANAAIKIGNALQKQSNVMIALGNIQLKAKAIAEELATKKTIAATAAQKVFNAVAKANPYVLLATVAVTAATAIGGYMIATKKANEEDKNRKAILESLKKAQEAYNNTYSSTLADLMTKYKKLQTEWRKLSSEQEKNKWIKENKKNFDELGKSVKNAADAENIFNKNSKFIIDGLIKRARAMAYLSQATALYNEAASKQAEVEAIKAEYLDKMANAKEIPAFRDPETGLSTPAISKQQVQAQLMLEMQNKLADKKMEQYELEQKAADILEKSVNLNSEIGWITSDNSKTTKNQLTELQKLINKTEDYKKAIQNIKYPTSEGGIKELDKYKKLLAEASKNVINYKVAIGVTVSKEEADDALYELNSEIKELNKQKISIDVNTEEGKKKADELTTRINELERQKLDFYISVGVAVDKEEAKKQIKYITDEISGIQNEIISIDVNTDEGKKQVEQLQKKLNELTRRQLNYKIAIDADINKEELEDAISVINSDLEDLENQKATIDVNTEEGKKHVAELQGKIDKLVNQRNAYTAYIDVKFNDPVDTFEKQAQKELKDAEYQIKLGAITDNKEIEEAGRKAYAVAKAKLDKLDIKPKTNVSEVEKIFKELNTNEPKYDFNFLPDNFKEQADEMLDRLNQLTDARKKWQDIVDKNENADEVAKANEALAQTKTEYDDLTAACQRFNEVSAQIKERTEDFEKFKNTISSINNVIGSIDSVVSSVQSMTRAFEEGANAWEQFMSIVQVAMSILSAVTTVMEIVNSVQDIMNTGKAVGASAVMKEATANAANATAITAATAATAAETTVSTAAIAPTIALAKAMEKLAAANIFAAHSYIPFVGPPMATAFVGMMEAVLATVGAFAQGGVVPGSSYTGDKLLARVNSGERILTATQNENLEKIANGVQGGNIQTTISSIKVQGRDLILAIKNELKVTGQKTIL